MSGLSLVADIGGTNVRMGLVKPDQPVVCNIRTYECSDFRNVDEAIALYLQQESVEISSACLAVACPTENDFVDITNNHWAFSQTELKKKLGLDELFVINDYPAIALSIPDLTDDQVVKIGGGTKVDNKPIAVFGPGTGLGVAMLVNVDGYWIDIPGEGGHVDYAPVDDNDLDILNYLRTLYPQHVSYEQLLSGLGLVQIYQAIRLKKGEPLIPLSPSEITEHALKETCTSCTQTLDHFCRIMGSFAGNLALTAGAFSGVYIAGGIVPRFVEYFAKSEFRKRFEEKGRLSSYVASIPTYVITESQPGLIGARAYLLSKLGRNK